MASPFEYTLIPWDDRDDGNLFDGSAFPTAGRTRWDFTLDVAKVGTSVTVVVKAGGDDDDDDFETLGTFNGGAISAAGQHTLTSYGDTPDFTVSPHHVWLKAEVTDQTGDVILRVTARSAFLDPTVSSDTNTLPKELREWNSTDLARTVEQAERDVRGLLLDGDPQRARVGRLDADLVSAMSRDEIRAMVAEQAQWLAENDDLRRQLVSGNASAAVTLRGRQDIKPELMDRIDRIRPVSHRSWRGR